ncbi:hypothetical protein BMQ_pBM30010 (plasmid) [Priestia megaterium QM B1551]|uniref:Uncharacterized protein n=1 Tax=Priestia megaterium (strain ATCC 12872 / QMB1551) TaxID=545693 RepID=D5E3A2_PRIM1|nr:hypothetical protein BMQ_pBM30010 [Priestia megaterium QM B1551]
MALEDQPHLADRPRQLVLLVLLDQFLLEFPEDRFPPVVLEVQSDLVYLVLLRDLVPLVALEDQPHLADRPRQLVLLVLLDQFLLEFPEDRFPPVVLEVQSDLVYLVLLRDLVPLVALEDQPHLADRPHQLVLLGQFLLEFPEDQFPPVVLEVQSDLVYLAHLRDLVLLVALEDQLHLADRPHQLVLLGQFLLEFPEDQFPPVVLEVQSDLVYLAHLRDLVLLVALEDQLHLADPPRRLVQVYRFQEVLVNLEVLSHPVGLVILLHLVALVDLLTLLDNDNNKDMNNNEDKNHDFYWNYP